MLRKYLPSRTSLSSGRPSHDDGADSAARAEISSMSRSALETELLALQGELANAKVQVAMLSGENDELRHELRALRKRYSISEVAAPAFAAGGSLLATIFSVMTFSFWRSGSAARGNEERHGLLQDQQLPPPSLLIAPAAARSEAKRALTVHKTFVTFSSAQLEAAVKALVEVACAPGDVIIRQGDQDDTRFYMVASGEYSVLVQVKGDTPVHTYRAVGDSFGELALRYGSARKATVRCEVGGVLWALEREQFQQIGRPR